MVSKWPQNNPEIALEDLNGFKLTFKNISIEILLLLWLFWVVTWLVCDKLEFGVISGPKWPEIAKINPKMTNNLN